MESEIKITLPVSVMIGKDQKFILNLNNFRNLQFFMLNKAKQNYTLKVLSIVKPLGFKIVKCELEYTYFRGSKRSYDLSNVCSVIDKFACDALTKRGFWDDDDVNTISKVTYLNGGYDKGNERCELIIKIIE